ncbi:hypothetical protein ACA910_002995 [Epithemia clementina (nom. ined.)]
MRSILFKNKSVPTGVAVKEESRVHRVLAALRTKPKTRRGKKTVSLHSFNSDNAFEGSSDEFQNNNSIQSDTPNAPMKIKSVHINVELNEASQSSEVMKHVDVEQQDHRTIVSTGSNATTQTTKSVESYTSQTVATVSTSATESNIVKGLPLAGSSTREIDYSALDLRKHQENKKALGGTEAIGGVGGNEPSRERANSCVTIDSSVLSDGEVYHDHIGHDATLQWCKVPGETLKVRSYQYCKTREKVPSPGELYQCLGVDFLDTPDRMAQMSTRVDLTNWMEHGHDSDDAETTWHAPNLFVVTLSIPLDTKPNGAEQSRCHTLTMYFGMTAETRNLLRRISAVDGGEASSKSKANDDDGNNNPKLKAVRLFNEWCKTAPTNPNVQGRFKFISHFANLDELGLPSWISKWSGKPVLIKRAGKTGFLYQQNETTKRSVPSPSSSSPSSCLSINNVMEMEISLHPFPWLTKKALSYLTESFFHKALPVFGFVIEGREEAELPEVLIGLCQLCYPDSKTAMTWEDFVCSGANRVRARRNSASLPRNRG